jgi:hypothetical protein
MVILSFLHVVVSSILGKEDEQTYSMKGPAQLAGSSARFVAVMPCRTRFPSMREMSTPGGTQTW